MLAMTLGVSIFCGLASLAGGFIDAISGGGGLLTMPALLICGIPPHIALGTNKIGACLGTTVALINFSANQLVKWQMVIYGVGFSLAGSWAGSLLALSISNELLAKILVVLLPFGMAATLFPKKSKKSIQHISDWHFWVLLPVVCTAIGLYDGFFGPATGSFLILALYWIIGIELVEASATAKAFNLASNFSAAISFIWHGAVFWPLAILMALCLMAGNWAGSTLAIRVGAKVVQKFLVISLLFLVITLIYQYFVL